jgi:hypothetical protein
VMGTDDEGNAPLGDASCLCLLLVLMLLILLPMLLNDCSTSVGSEALRPACCALLVLLLLLLLLLFFR